ncbi:MAG: NAD+ synthase [Candidatus Bipolaricaulia bacterium]
MRLRIGLAQINPTVGDLEGNARKIQDYIARAGEEGVELLAFPELALTGYPPEDLLLKPSFISANLEALAQLVEEIRGITVVLGFVDRDQDIYNAAAVIYEGRVAGVHRKVFLPNYAVFDEDRYFAPGRETSVFSDGQLAFGVTICEDIWYPDGPAKLQTLSGGAQLALNIAASPYYLGRGAERERMLSARAADQVAIVAFCNLVGGQDELVFDGRSLIFDEQGQLLARGKQFEEDLLIADLDLERVFNRRLHDPRRRKERLGYSLEGVDLRLVELDFQRPRSRERGSLIPCPRIEPELASEEEAYRALVLGTRDYARKNGFTKAVLGLSGGIDSALVAAIAADALGKENVVGVFMPSSFTSQASREDAEAVAANLGIKLLSIGIDRAYQAYLELLAEPFSGTKPGVAEENLQARIRGNILMALSNKFGWLVLNTGNKSELSLGYTTLYGDMAGGFAVLKDVPKTLVYRLARYRNAISPVIPSRVLEKPPSAELRPNQKDEADLPAPYAALDPILKAYVEEDRGLREIVELGFPEETVRRVIELVDKNEYKRRQSPPGIRITPRAFGKDRRLPITNRFTPR